MKTFRKFIEESRNLQAEDLAEGEVVQEDGKLSRAAKVLGHAGGEKGGPARAKKLSSKKKSQIARKGANARWHKKGGKKSS